MNDKIFPRKEFYFYTFDQKVPHEKSKVSISSQFLLNSKLKSFSDKKWEIENGGWVSSKIPSALEVEYSQEGDLIVHAGFSEYKYLLGMVKMATELKTSDLPQNIHGLSIEMFPLFSDERFILKRRGNNTTQHGVDFYDIPTASQCAEFYISQAEKEYPGLVKDILDLSGFPRWHMASNLCITPDEIEKMHYVGFSRGFEVSLDTQHNGCAELSVSGEEVYRRIGKRESLDDFLIYNIGDIPSLFDSIGKRKGETKEDLRGNSPRSNSITEGFALVDCCLGTILSTLYHKNLSVYSQAREILVNKGYTINEEVLSPGSRVKLDTLS